MSGKWLRFVILALGMMFISLFQVNLALAEEPTPENDANCLSCHERQYYLYDNGKYYCLCNAPMHCIYCHNGRTDSLDEEVAHEGLVLYPTRNNAERCQECHEKDTMERVVTFASVAGISATPRSVVTATPDTSIEAPMEQVAISPLRLGQLETWRLVGLGLVGMAMIVLVFLGYRCWKADCLAKLKS
jgi:hypothetical protein